HGAPAKRADYLNGKHLSFFETFIAVEMERGNRGVTNRWNKRSSERGSKKLDFHLSTSSSFLTDQTVQRESAAIEQAAETLRNKLESLVVQTTDFLQLEILDNQAAFAFQRRLVNLTPHKAESVRL